MEKKDENKEQAEKKKLTTKILSLATMTKVEGKVSQNMMPTNKILAKRKYKKKQRPLTNEQVEVFRQAFDIFDTNHSGSIDQGELQSLLNALGFTYTTSEVKRIFEDVDEDGSGVIEINQFVDFMSRQILDTDSLKKQIGKVFKYYDDDGAGFLDEKKIKNMLNECCFNLDDESIKNMIAVADTEGDGKINQYQFFRIMKKVKLI